MGVVLLAMTIGGLVIAAIAFVIAYSAKIGWLKTFVLGGVFTWLAGYLILLAIGSIFSVERTLAFNEPKEFCGFYFDCHIHTAVTGVRTAKTIGRPLGVTRSAFSSSTSRTCPAAASELRAQRAPRPVSG